MMDPLTGLNRGYAFVTFTTTDAAHEAVRQVPVILLFPSLWIRQLVKSMVWMCLVEFYQLPPRM